MKTPEIHGNGWWSGCKNESFEMMKYPNFLNASRKMAVTYFYSTWESELPEFSLYFLFIRQLIIRFLLFI